MSVPGKRKSEREREREREKERERELKWIDYDPQVVVRRSDYTPITEVNRLRFRKVGLW